MKRSGPARLAGAVLALLFGLRMAVHADAGALQFSERAGNLLVSVFTDPGVPAAGDLEVNVLVQDAESRRAVLDAEVAGKLTLETAPSGSDAWAPPICAVNTTSRLEGFPLVHLPGQNLLYYAASVRIPSGGQWRFRVDVKTSAAPAAVAAGVLPVTPARAPWTGYWHLFGLPVVAIGLFAAVQRRRASRAHPLVPPSGHAE